MLGFLLWFQSRIGLAFYRDSYIAHLRELQQRAGNLGVDQAGAQVYRVKTP